MRRLILAACLCGAAALPAAAQQARSISASDRQQGAQANPQLVAEYGGVYRGPQATFVERVGKRVAVESGLSNASGDFTVQTLNSPVENAFAIPGGYVYVTRQLLALMNSEAELASVLGHEVGHVAANHSRGRQQASGIGSILGSLGQAAAGRFLGSGIAGALGTRAAQIAPQLAVLGYGRNQEYEADALGVRYITAAGYDPYAAASMLTQLNAETTLSARVAGQNNAVPTWMSTHPNGADRVARARKLAQATGKAPATGAQDTAFLRMLDGLPYDDDPQQGVVDGQRFVHPTLRLRFDAPAGYKIANGADAVTVVGSGGQAQMKTAPATTDLAGFVRQQMASLGATQTGDVQAGSSASGLRYAATTTRANASGRVVNVTVVAYSFPNATNWFTLVTPAGSGIAPFQPLLSSVATLTPAQAAAVRGKVVRVVAVRAGDTIDSLAARMAYPDYRRERFTTLNGVASDADLRPGMLVKLVVNG